MAVEIANWVAACGVVGLADPPVVMAERGLRAAAPQVERVSQGLYRLHLAEAILADLVTPDVQGFAMATINFGGANSVRTLECSLNTAGYVTVTARDIANAVQDGATIQFVVYRLPTID